MSRAQETKDTKITRIRDQKKSEEEENRSRRARGNRRQGSRRRRMSERYLEPEDLCVAPERVKERRNAIRRLLRHFLVQVAQIRE